MNKNEKKRVYDEHVHNVEHGTFFFSAAGSMGPIATTLYKPLAVLLITSPTIRQCIGFAAI